MHKAMIYVVAALNALIAVVTYLYYGFNVAGATVAARNTARVSAVVFALAFATYCHRRWGTLYLGLIYAFVAAHVVHFGTVIAYHALLGKLFVPMFLGLASAGAMLLTATAFTTTRMPKLHLALVYALWLSFLVALSSRLSKHLLPETPVLVLLALAMLVHATSAFRSRAKQRASAAAN